MLLFQLITCPQRPSALPYSVVMAWGPNIGHSLDEAASFFTGTGKIEGKLEGIIEVYGKFVLGGDAHYFSGYL